MSPTAERATPAVLALFALGVAALYPIDNPDTFGHLAAGRQIAALGHVPTLDTFSYFRPNPARGVNYEWLSDQLMYAVYHRGGAVALNVAKLALLMVIGGLLMAAGHRRAGFRGVALVSVLLVAGLPGERFRLSARPQVFGSLFASLYVLGLHELLLPRSRRATWTWVAGLTLAHVCWVNLHGSHLFGLLLIGCALGCAVRERTAWVPLAALLGLALVASCVSPYGPDILRGAFAHVFDPAYRALIDEWQAWKPSQSPWYPVVFVWQSALLGIALWPQRRARGFGFDAAYSIILLLMAARSLRFLADYVALTTPIIAGGLAPHVAALPEPRQRALTRASSAGALALALLICPRVPPGARIGIGERSAGRPMASAQWLATYLPDARILAAMSDAWDLMFSLPAAKFLLDGRTPLYGPEHIARVQRAWSSGALMRQLIDDTRTDVVIIQPMVTEQQPALRALLGFHDFRLMAIEDRHCVFARELPARIQLMRERALTTLMPGYGADWVLAEPVDLDRVGRELKLLPAHPNVDAYRSWVSALVALKPLARAGGRAGIAPPRTAAERRLIAGALVRLRAADRELEIVPTVAVYHGLTAVAACELDEAHAAFERAAETERVREITFGEQELALRAGRPDDVREFVRAARALPEAANDPWLAALEAALDHPARCSDEPPQE
jgi:hypothetical protein